MRALEMMVNEEANWFTKEDIIANAKETIKTHYRISSKRVKELAKRGEKSDFDVKDIPLQVHFNDRKEPGKGYILTEYLVPFLTPDEFKKTVRMVVNTPSIDVEHLVVLSTAYVAKAQEDDYNKLMKKYGKVSNFPENMRKECIIISYECSNGDYESMGYEMDDSGRLTEVDSLNTSGNFNSTGPHPEGAMVRLLNDPKARTAAILSGLKRSNDDVIKDILDEEDPI